MRLLLERSDHGASRAALGPVPAGVLAAWTAVVGTLIAISYAANVAVIAVVAPLVEETTYRGLGSAAVGAVTGPALAILVTGLSFGLAHGLVLALPVLAALGVALAWLRWQTMSIYPPIAAHALFNTAALVAAVTV